MNIDTLLSYFFPSILSRKMGPFSSRKKAWIKGAYYRGVAPFYFSVGLILLVGAGFTLFRSIFRSNMDIFKGDSLFSGIGVICMAVAALFALINSLVCGKSRNRGLANFFGILIDLLILASGLLIFYCDIRRGYLASDRGAISIGMLLLILSAMVSLRNGGLSFVISMIGFAGVVVLAIYGRRYFQISRVHIYIIAAFSYVVIKMLIRGLHVRHAILSVTAQQALILERKKQHKS